MELENRKPAVAGGLKDQNKICKKSLLRPGTKIHSVAEALAHGRSLNRFEAYRALHDSVLNSTGAEIQARGILVSRKEEVVPGFRGSQVRCCRYWLEPEERAKAAALLGWRQ